MRDFFELFGLAPAFAIEPDELERRYRRLQAQVHPDRFAAASDAERRASLQWTTRVNEAYRTLKDPVQRGRHLLELEGIDVGFETNTQMPTDFLMRQLELREALEAAVGRRDGAALDALRGELREARGGLERDLAAAIDARRDFAGATELVRKLMFLERLDDEIDAAYEAAD